MSRPGHRKTEIWVFRVLLRPWALSRQRVKVNGVSPLVQQGQRAKGPESPKGHNFPRELMSQHISRRDDWSQLGKGLGLELVIVGIVDIQVSWGPWNPEENPTGEPKTGVLQWQKMTSRWQHLPVNPGARQMLTAKKILPIPQWKRGRGEAGGPGQEDCLPRKST